MKNEKETKTGLYAIGWVQNKTFLSELCGLVDGHPAISLWELNQNIDKAEKEYLNGFGYPSAPDGTKVTQETAKYIRFCLPYKNDKGEQLYGWFSRNRLGGFTGVEWGSLNDFEQIRIINSYFNIGSMYFESYQDGPEFLEDIAKSTIPETWKYKNKPSAINHPILKSYLENILNRLIKEDDGSNDKLVYSKDRKYVLFNTNLLDKYFHEVLIAGEAGCVNGELRIKNPFRTTGLGQLRKLGFSNNPLPPQFFDDVNEVIFQTSWEIDKDYDTFTHIIEERRDRFPNEYHDTPTEELASKFDNAINFAVALTQRNYKFIVPMYRPQDDKIQLLMPIYLKGTYAEQPDFALILTPNKELSMYEPETILPLDAAYQNARLIAKPEESWLNPDKI